jgi:hypothetical protein
MASFKAFPSSEFLTATVSVGTILRTEAYWDVIAYILSQFPVLDAQGISGYTFVAPNFRSSVFKSPLNGFLGVFMLPVLHPSNSSSSFEAVLTKLIRDATAPYPYQFRSSVTMKSYPDFWGYYAINNGPLDAGHDQIIGSRLLDKQALTQNLTLLKESFKAATPAGHVTSAFLVSGKGVHNAKPRGGSNSVNPAWRKGYVHSCISKPLPLTLDFISNVVLQDTNHHHAVLGVAWQPFNTAERSEQQNILTNTYVDALRKLAPDMGAYLNEVHNPIIQICHLKASYHDY